MAIQVSNTALLPDTNFATIAWKTPTGEIMYADVGLSSPATTAEDVLANLPTPLPWLYIGIAVLVGIAVGHFIWK